MESISTFRLSVTLFMHMSIILRLIFSIILHFIFISLIVRFLSSSILSGRFYAPKLSSYAFFIVNFFPSLILNSLFEKSLKLLLSDKPSSYLLALRSSNSDCFEGLIVILNEILQLLHILFCIKLFISENWAKEIVPSSV